MARDISELREFLFQTLEGIKEGTINTDQAKDIRDVSQVIVDSAKVEVQFLDKVGGVNGTSFITMKSNEVKKLN